jgi:hypothetical protein
MHHIDGAMYEHAGDIRLGADNSALLYAGTEPGEQAVVALQPGTVAVTMGLPDLGPRIVLTADSLTLAVGPPDVGAQVQLTATGVTISFMGVNTLTINADGISAQGLNLNLQATVAYALKTLALQEQVAGAVERQASITTIQ